MSDLTHAQQRAARITLRSLTSRDIHGHTVAWTHIRMGTQAHGHTVAWAHNRMGTDGVMACEWCEWCECMQVCASLLQRRRYTYLAVLPDQPVHAIHTWQFFMYSSTMEVNCSVPAVSMISSLPHSDQCVRMSTLEAVVAPRLLDAHAWCATTEHPAPSTQHPAPSTQLPAPSRCASSRAQKAPYMARSLPLPSMISFR